MRLSRRLSPHAGHSARRLFRRLDKVAGDLNILLIAIAVGLATLDMTFLLTQKIVERLPRVTRVVHVEAPAQPVIAASQLR